MTKVFSRSALNVDSVGSWLLILFGFTLPLSVAVNNLFAILIILLWFYKKEYRKTWEIVKSSKVVIAVLLLFLLHIIGMLWTIDPALGLKMIRKGWMFLLLPMMMSFVKREHIQYYISAFLIAISISELLSYLIWFEVIPPFLRASLYDPTPFIHHTSYNPFLAFAIYLTGYYMLFDKTLSRMQKILLLLFFFTMSVNMFITGGRAGQVGYFVVVVILFFQFFNKHFFRALFLSVLFLSVVLFTAYSSSQIFQDRAKLMVSQVQNFHNDKNTSTGLTGNSVGLRINYAINTFEIIKEHPLIGVGTGGYEKSYKVINDKNSPDAEVHGHPHNMYLFEMVQFGLFGLISLLSILYFQLRFAWKETNMLRSKAGIALPLLFSVIMLSDSYLLGHFTTMLFVFFSAFLYRPFNETD